MPINTAIYANRVQPDVGNALQAYATMRQVANNNAATAMQNQLQQYQLQKAQDEDASNKLLKMAYGANTNPDGTINYSGVSSYLAKNDGGDQIPGIAKQQRADAVDAANLAKLHAETDKATLEAHMGKLGVMARLAGSVTDQASYENALKLAPQFGIDVSGMPAQYDSATIKQIRDASLSYADQLGQLWKQKEYDQKQQEITGNQALKKQDQNLRERDLALSQRKLDNDMRNQATNVDLKKQELAIQQQKQANDNADRANAKQGAVASYDTAISTLDRLASHPGKSAVVGAPNPLQGGFGFATVRGTPAADFSAELETFKSQTFLPMVQSLRGMGALSDAEGKKLSAAVGALDPRMGEDAFNASIGRIRSDLEAAKNRALSSMGQPQAKTGIAHPADIGDLLKKYGAK